MLANKQTQLHIFSIWLSFLFSLFAVVTLASFTLNNTVSQPTYMKSKISSSGFAKKAASELEEIFRSYGAASGFEVGVFAPLLDEKKIANDMSLTIDKIYAQTPGPDKDEAKRIIFTALVENVNSRDIVISKEVQDGIDELAKTCAYDYINKVSLPYVDYITLAVNKVNSVISKFTVFLWGGMLVLAACILLVNKFSHRCFRYFAYACGTVFVVLSLIPAVVLLSDKLSYISITPVSLNNLFVDYLNGVFKVMLSISFGALILSVLCIGCYYTFRNKVLKRVH